MDQLKIVVVMIVKNEEKMLSRCLDSIKGVDNIYIVDTGSIDNTVEVAKRYTENVYTDYKWNDSFAEARNHALSKVKEENAYVLSIDADEYMVTSVNYLREQVRKAEEMKSFTVDIKLVEEKTKESHYFPRLFKKDPTVFWEGAIHNYINTIPKLKTEVEVVYGYSPAHTLDPNRALRILEKECKKPNHGAREEYYYAREFWYRKNYKQCVDILNEYVKKTGFLAERADAFLYMARCYWAMGMGEEARLACMQAIVANPHFKEAVQFMATLAGKGSGNPAWESNGDWWLSAAERSNNNNVLFIRT